MDFMTAAKTCLIKKYACFKGRASRSEYWYFYLFYTLASIVGTVILSLINVSLGLIFPMIWMLGTILPNIAVAVRRLHDVDLSGWWLLISITGIGGIVLLYWLIIKGTNGPNRFGPDSVADDLEANLDKYRNLIAKEDNLEQK